MNTLVIVESPGKVKKLASILGPSYRIMPSKGHVRDLPEKEIGVEPPEFRPSYVPTTKGKPILADLRQQVPRCRAVDGQLLTLHTKAPSRYKLTTLVTELESLGIGRPSTYAAILDNITARGYIIEGAKDFLYPSAAGEAIRDALVGTFQFADLDYTRELEAQLDRIAEGALPYLAVVRDAYTQLDDELAKLGERAPITIEDPDAIACPVCNQGTLRRRKGTKGFFWGCSRWQEGCSTTFPDNRGKPAFGGKEAHDCPTCSKGVLRPRQSANGKFWGCSCYPECKATFPDKRGRPDLTARKGGGR